MKFLIFALLLIPFSSNASSPAGVVYVGEIAREPEIVQFNITDSEPVLTIAYTSDREPDERELCSAGNCTSLVFVRLHYSDFSSEDLRKVMAIKDTFEQAAYTRSLFRVMAHIINGKDTLFVLEKWL